MLFVVGVGRSGTSLLQSMLASNSSVHAVPETSFLRRYAFALRVPVKASVQDAHLGRVSGLSTLPGSGGRSALIGHFLACVSDGSSRGMVLDKDPRLVEYLSLLPCAFDDFHVVHIFRDPRDVLASKKAAAWSRGRSLISYLVASHVQLHAALRYGKRHRLIHVRYEELIAEPEAQLRQVCEHLGIPFEPDMLQHTEAARKLVHTSELSWKKETFEPVMASNSGKWKKALTKVEAEAALWVVPRAIRRYYTSSSAVTALARQPRVALYVLSARLLGTVYQAMQGLVHIAVRQELKK